MDLNKIGKNRQELITAFVFIWFTAVMPLYYKDGYFNILQAKGNAFGLGCLIAIVLILVFSIRDLSPERSLTDAGQMILAASALISCVLSGDFFTAFAGYEGWCVGGFALLAGALIYLWLSRNGEVGKGLWYLFMAVNAFIFLLFLASVYEDEKAPVFKIEKAIDRCFVVSRTDNGSDMAVSTGDNTIEFLD